MQVLNPLGLNLLAQPVAALRDEDGRPRFEVLLRMSDSDGESISSGSLFSAAERYNLMPQIDRWVINATLVAISGGEIKLPTHRSCAINLSGQTLCDAEIMDYIRDRIEHHGIDASHLCFEITETAVIATAM